MTEVTSVLVLTVKVRNFGMMQAPVLRTRRGYYGREARECGRRTGRNAIQNRQLEEGI